VREAIGQLEREGLLVREPNRGARVVELNEQTVREVGSLRSLLEGYAASLAARRMRAEDFRALDAVLDRMAEAAAAGQFARLLELDYEFHAFICRASGHRALYETWSAMGGKIRLYLSATNLAYRDLKGIVTGHRQVADALRARDASRASRALGRHLAEVLELCVQTMRAPDRRGRPARRATVDFSATR
jgi:DNA-binding GntR family transcriptional regulator